MRDLAAAEYSLNERIKELTALHAVARLMLHDEMPIASQLQAVSDLLPPAMQFPDVATGCIRHGDLVYSSSANRDSKWLLSSPFCTADGVSGSICVAYQEERAFLDEEVVLLGSIAEMVRAALDRRLANQSMHKLNERLCLALDTVRMGVWEWTLDDNVVRWSEHLAGMTGLTTLEGKFAEHSDLVHPDDREDLFRRLEHAANGADDLQGLAFRFRRPEGGWRHMAASATITREPPARATRILAALVDVSERRALEDGLRHAQKLEALGQVASSVAHDFNNLLAVVLAGADQLDEELPADSPWREVVGDILSTVNRGTALTRQLLAFSRKTTYQPSVVDVGNLIRQLEPLLARIAKRPIKLRLEISADAGRVWADPVQIEQVVMNLVVNARDVLPNGGNIIVRASAIQELENNWVAIVVTDDGPGIDDAVKAKIFEPFFTTKEVGKGTGLGLAVVAGVAKQWRGRVEFESSPGTGATFRVLLPRFT